MVEGAGAGTAPAAAIPPLGVCVLRPGHAAIAQLGLLMSYGVIRSLPPIWVARIEAASRGPGGGIGPPSSARWLS